ncbi:TetR/AcrR family transcriptional regulator [Frankia sp. QA3]|uniref:TetR/AcrR family transcriptional regulator n=1 Tax=Frankia sp. QA3 TaxID=710111 RepID=UPI000269C2CC|nr:TetR/AcrR family transcriptional regulator [Frankia sp. QA3]EIV91097.1 transcriptional regulator [Frankia sp. QA3]
MRADAQRNRELIATTALDLLARRGPAVSMEEIARAAGLGVGTLYRHFPDRQSLLDSVAATTLRTLLAAGRAEVSSPAPRWQVLVRILERCAGLPLALITSLTDATRVDPTIADLVEELNALFQGLAEAAQREGSLRADLTGPQVVGLLNVAVCRPGARPDDPLTTVLLDGLRARRQPPADTPPAVSPASRSHPRRDPAGH